jgi:hypothetical protein
MQARQAALQAALSNQASDQELAREYGGSKLLMAATDLERAEPCLLNAKTLAPSDPRWPSTWGTSTGSAGRWKRRWNLRAGAPDASGRLRCAGLAGEMRLSEGRPDAATPLFAKALARDSGSAAAL